MNKFISIRTKLIGNTMLLISITFAILLSVIIITNILTVNKNIEKSTRTIRSSLIAKGKTLARNNSMAMSGMAEDNAFTAIQNLVASTVADDEDLVYGIYMDNNSIPWVYANAANPEGVPESNNPLADSLSKWASSLKIPAFKEHTTGNTTVIEFAAPVGSDEQILGFIRYGISTESMEQSIKEARAAGNMARLQIILIISTMGLISLVIGLFMIKQLAARITSPIASLVNSSKIIAEGNLDVTVHPESNDEIGDLATHFEAMRVTIRKYTDHLQDLIDEKMQQVNDILNNIDQGLFTINLDGSVNQEYSARANTILKVSDVASCTIKDLLRFDTTQENSFYTWLNLVKKRHTQQRWPKLARLAPVQEIELLTQTESNEMEYISISYQRIYDKNGNLSKIMILALDETEKRLKDLQMAAERLKHENDVKAILSIANTPAEEIAEFTEDTSVRMHELHTQVALHLEEVNHQRNNHPGAPPYIITKEHIDSMYRDLHTIKGNSGSYGFEMLSHFSHQAEDELEKLRHPVTERRGLILESFSEMLSKMDQALEEIHQKIRLIFGRQEEISVRIPESRINNIIEMSKSIQEKSRDPATNMLIAECIMLSWKPLKTLLRKYQKIALKLARRQRKDIQFNVVDETILYPGDTLSELDDVLIHIIRNAVDHGIEEPEIREELEKGTGKIQVTFEIKDGKKILSINDDGRGMDSALLLEKSVEKGIISRKEAENLTDDEIYDFLFNGGISTSQTVSDISGRGMGMHTVYRKITGQLNGTLKIDSTFGKGTTFTISIPDKKGY